MNHLNAVDKRRIPRSSMAWMNLKFFIFPFKTARTALSGEGKNICIPIYAPSFLYTIRPLAKASATNINLMVSQFSPKYFHVLECNMMIPVITCNNTPN
jgi:hypothetical protein